MDRRKILRFFLLPTLAGLVAVGAVYLYLQSATRSAATAVQEPTVPVVVANQAIPARTRLTAEMVAIRQVPRNLTWNNALDVPEKAVGQLTTKDLAAGEPVLTTHVAVPENQEAGLAFRVPPGQRAFTVAVDELTGVAGHLKAGDRVDLVVILPEAVAGVRKSLLLLENLQVLALDPPAPPAANNPGSAPAVSPYRLATVAVRPEQAVDLALAVEVAEKVRAVLRPAQAEGEKGRLSTSADSYK